MAPKPTLDEAIRRLYAREINCSVETFWDGGVAVYLGDWINGRRAEGCFDIDQLDEAAQWLLDMADKYYPTADAGTRSEGEPSAQLKTEASEQRAAGVSEANLEGE